MMLSESDTQRALSQGPICSSWDAKVPLQAWVVEHEVFAYRGIELAPFKGSPEVVWTLVNVLSMSLTRRGINVIFQNSSSAGWFPSGNARLAA